MSESKRIPTMGDKLKELEAVDPRLFSDWEKRFLKSLIGRAFGSEQQEEWVTSIHEKHFPAAK